MVNLILCYCTYGALAMHNTYEHSELVKEAESRLLFQMLIKKKSALIKNSYFYWFSNKAASTTV